MSRYVVIDLEMCRVPKAARCEEFPCANELIQIGAVLLNGRYEVEGTFMRYVKPSFGQVDQYIERLTGITPRMLEDAPSAAQALAAFADWMPQDALLVTWSDNDTRQIGLEMTHKQIRSDALRARMEDYIDCQQLFSERMQTTRLYRLFEALAITDTVCTAREHDALEDARNTAALFGRLQKEWRPVSKYLLTQEEMSARVIDPFRAARCAG